MKEITIKEGFEKLKQGALLIDVREVDEVKELAYDVENVINIPLSEINIRYKEISANQDVIIGCKSGGRSAKTVQFLNEQGFDNVMNLQGGIIAWIKEGLSVKTK